jgi:tRNA-2-methylthio-N6-dimethylallyladenosine synthase
VSISNIINGCNEHCVYCVVPVIHHGIEKSQSMESIHQECLGGLESGYKEVTLLGHNIEAYARDVVPKRTFAKLLEYLNAKLPGKICIGYMSRPLCHHEMRHYFFFFFSFLVAPQILVLLLALLRVTSHPRYFSNQVINAVAQLDQVWEYFHMPFQASDNKVLKHMRQGYTFESHMKIVEKICAKAPDAMSHYF